MNFVGYIATLPGVLVGIMVAASLQNVYVEPSANAAFGVLLSDMMNKGGVAEFVAVVASCSAVAAVMSTADSCIIGLTNVLSRDFLNNWLFVLKPSYKTDRFASLASKLTSLAITIVAISVTLNPNPNPKPNPNPHPHPSPNPNPHPNLNPNPHPNPNPKP